VLAHTRHSGGIANDLQLGFHVIQGELLLTHTRQRLLQPAMRTAGACPTCRFWCCSRAWRASCSCVCTEQIPEMGATGGDARAPAAPRASGARPSAPAPLCPSAAAKSEHRVMPCLHTDAESPPFSALAFAELTIVVICARIVSPKRRRRRARTPNRPPDSAADSSSAKQTSR
jgi:hypothetical protein